MSDFKQRVQDEKDELDKKLGALLSFLSCEAHEINIDPHQLNLLQKQYYAMLHYSEILQERIECFE